MPEEVVNRACIQMHDVQEVIMGNVISAGLDQNPARLDAIYAGLPPVFKKDGILTAGNSSQISDGAAALVMTSETKAEGMGVKPFARIIGYTTGGTKPEVEAPIPMVKTLLSTTGFTMDDLVEYNEAYASASITIMRELNIPPEIFPGQNLEKVTFNCPFIIEMRYSWKSKKLG